MVSGHAVGCQVGSELRPTLAEGVIDVLKEDEPEDNVLVLTGIHRPAELVGSLPEGRPRIRAAQSSRRPTVCEPCAERCRRSCATLIDPVPLWPPIAAPTVGDQAKLERVGARATLGENASSCLHNPAYRAPVLLGDAIERLQGVVGQGDGASFHAHSVAKSHSALSD